MIIIYPLFSRRTVFSFCR